MRTEMLSNSRRFFDEDVFVSHSNSEIDQEHFSLMCIRIFNKVKPCEKREVRASNSKIDGVQIFYVCVCVLNS